MFLFKASGKEGSEEAKRPVNSISWSDGAVALSLCRLATIGKTTLTNRILQVESSHAESCQIMTIGQWRRSQPGAVPLKFLAHL